VYFKHVFPAFSFTLTQIGIIIAVAKLALLLVLLQPTYCFKLRGEEWLVPAVLFTDMWLGLLGTLNVMCALSRDSKLGRTEASIRCKACTLSCAFYSTLRLLPAHLTPR